MIGSQLIGVTLKSNNYGDFTIIDYQDFNHVTIKFLATGFLLNTTMHSVNKRNVKDYSVPNFAFKLGVNAVIGIGEYNSKANYDAYTAWSGMMTRCYNKHYHQTRPTYANCSVCNEWLNFQNFAKWYYGQIKEDGWMLDKDIISKHNKLYCPEYCAFVPKNINSLFTKANSVRGEYPIGVSLAKQYRKKQDKYYEYLVAECSDGNGHNIHLGIFDSVIEAFNAYKEYKESLIKRIANENQSRIDPRIYNAMINYKVEITD